MDYDEMAETAAEIGFEGIALTVRPRGHVLPEEVEDRLPLAVEAIQKAGLRVPMMTTAITDPEDPLTETILKTASDLGIGYYRMGYLNYRDDLGVAETLESYKSRMRALADMNASYGIHGAYQNHSGTRVGGAVWDLWHVLEGLDPTWIGCQYDVRHATVEGGRAWPVGMRLLAPYIQITAIKDFYWKKEGDRWEIENTPLGTGMVRFDQYVKLAEEYQIAGPISLHFEYGLPHDRHGSRTPEVKEETIRVMKRDVNWLKDRFGS